ncbi:MAG: hypothetical protein AAF211_17430, partial [Myxococcota bacterium]
MRRWPWLLIGTTGCSLLPEIGGSGLIGDLRATVDFGGDCGQSFEAGADIVGLANDSAVITFFTPSRDRDENCSEGFAWEWTADRGELGPFSANACLFGVDVFFESGALIERDGEWFADGIGGI